MTASPGAIRAAEHIHSWQQINDWPEGSSAPPTPRVEALAKIIDRESGLPELLAVCEKILAGYNDPDKGVDFDWMTTGEELRIAITNSKKGPQQ